MKTQKYIGEILSLVAQQQDENKKIKILKDNKHTGIPQLCRFAYDPNYVPLIREMPDYKEDDSPYGYSYSNLLKEYHRINYFFDYPDKHKAWKIDLGRMRRILQGILSRIHWSDSAILVAILTRREIPNLPLDLAIKIYPELSYLENKETIEEKS
jgi:hypothetical protein